MKASPTRISIEVTEQDIERAHKSDSYKCVVAQAVARTVKDATRIEVDTQTIRFTRSTGERWLYLTPYAVQGYVIAFDAGDPIEPFSFQLRDPRRAGRRIRTEAGKAIQAAAKRERKQKPAEPLKVGTTSSEKAPVVPSMSEAEDSSDSLESVKAAYADATRSKTDGGRPAPPRVFKKKTRSYGHRLLRINQEP